MNKVVSIEEARKAQKLGLTLKAYRIEIRKARKITEEMLNRCLRKEQA